MPVRICATSSAGESRTSSEPGLNAAPTMQTGTPAKLPPAQFPAGTRGRAVAGRAGPPAVAGAPFGQDAEPGTGGELPRAGHAGPVVLRQAAAAVAEPGAQEGRADPRVGAEDLRQVPDV